MTSWHRYGFALVLAVVTSSPCLGEGDTAGNARPSSEDDNRDQPSVYVADSYEARTTLRRADRLAASKRWREAARAYQSVIEQHADKLVRSDAQIFVGTVGYVNERLAHWPTEGLKIYRLLYADHAQRQLTDAESKRDLPALLTITDAYFCTRQAASAADLAAQLAMEAGDFDLARNLYKRLLDHHPDREALSGELKTKLALCYAWSGQTERARSLLKEIEAKHAKAALLWAGQRRTPAQVIEDALAHRAEPVPEKGSTRWPMIAGSLGRNRLFDGDVEPGAPMWEFGPDEGFEPEHTKRRRPRPRGGYYGARGAGQDLAIVPVTDGQCLYFCDRTCIWGIRLAGAVPLWPTYSLSSLMGRQGTTRSLTEPPELYTCTLHAGRLYAALGQLTYLGRQARSRSAGLLVCLDVVTGRPAWTMDLTELGSGLEGIWLDSAPVYYQGRLFAVGRRRKRFGFEDCYLVCFDAATGRTAWSCHLASASVGGYGLRRATLTFPTISEATVYVCTNLGVIAAVNAYTGGIRWLRLYHKDRREEEASARYALNIPPWRYTPPICWRENLICSPLDDEHVIVLRRTDGGVISRIESGQLSRFTQILGVVDDVLYAVGRELVAWDLNANEERWSRALAGTGGKLLGRGMLTRSYAYLPTAKGLYRFRLKGGQPRGYEWPEDAVGGNLLMLSDQIVVAGSDRITGYAPKGEAFVRLEHRIEAAPNDPVPLLELAELAYRVKERPMGIDALDRAVKVSGGFAQLSDPAIKARIFRDYIRFGDKALGDDPPNDALALMMYKRAAQCPPDLDAQVTHRVRLAEAFMAARKIGQAIEQYQQLIEDRSLRGRAARPRGSDEGWPAGQWAEEQIAALLAEQGRELYEPIERRARTMLTVARDQSDLGAIQRVIDGFPNSLAAMEALRVKAELLEQRDDYRQAVRAYVQLLQRSPKQAGAPQIIRRIAEAYLHSKRPSAAGRWLARGARLYPDYRFERQGQSIGFDAYRRLIAGQDAITPAVPRFSLPLSERWSRKFPNWVYVLPPVHADLLTTRWDLYVVHSAGQVQAFAAPGGKSRWTSPVQFVARPTLLGMTRRRLVLANRRKLTGLDISTGSAAWSIEAYSINADGPEVDPEDLRKWSTWTMTEDRVFAVLDDGQATCIEADTGRVMWRARLAGRVGVKPTANEEFLVYEAVDRSQQRTLLHVLDAESGREIRRIKTGDLGRLFWMTISQQGLLLAATSRQLLAFDPYTGAQAWKDDLAAANLRATLLLGPASLYLSHNGRTLTRRSIETGRLVAESKPLAGALSTGGIPVLHGSRLFVRTPQTLTALDALTLDLLWRGTTDRRENLVAHQVCQGFVIAIGQRSDLAGNRSSQRYTAYFYDRRDDSGILHPSGGFVDLGTYESPRGPYFADHTILIADGDTLYGWTGPGL
jgi:outer membrane protein assembly factor BamB/tetratricopeptide (TPR) repeat protein